MKILVISQYYYPEPFKIHDICEQLVNMGNEVTVVTGMPNYPDGVLFDGYENKMQEIINGVTVLRTPIKLRGKSAITLLQNYLSYPIQAIKKLKTLKDEFDIVFVYQLSPVFIILPALYYKKKKGKKVFTYCLDLWPESLKVLHLSDTNIIYKIVKVICNYIYSKCDFISVTSPDFISYINSVNKYDKKCISFIPQHGEKMFLDVKPLNDTDKLNITFAGNIGKAQDFETLIKAISIVSQEYYDKFKITILGNGSYFEELKSLIKKSNLSELFFLEGRKKLDELVDYYDKTSLFYISLEKGSQISKTIPSKLQTYLASGRGIIGTIDGVSNKIINENNLGKVANAGDYEELARIIVEMIDSDHTYINKLATNAREYYLDNFTLEYCTKQIYQKLEELSDE